MPSGTGTMSPMATAARWTYPPDRDHGAGYAGARDVGGPEREEVGGQPVADHGVEEEHVRCRHVDDRLSRTGNGVGKLYRHQRFWAPEMVHLDCPHLTPLVVSPRPYLLKFT